MPGLVVTQYCGSGEANHYILRGYNLDHGTDLSLFAEAVQDDGPFQRPEDASVEGSASTLVNLRLGWHNTRWEIALDALNLFDQADNDIEYHYASRLPGEPVDGIEGTHIHPVEPRAIRLMLA